MEGRDWQVCRPAAFNWLGGKPAITVLDVGSHASLRGFGHFRRRDGQLGSGFFRTMEGQRTARHFEFDVPNSTTLSMLLHALSNAETTLKKPVVRQLTGLNMSWRQKKA